MNLFIHEDAWCMIANFCDPETLIHLSNCNKNFQGMVFNNQTHKKWDLKTTRNLIKHKNVALAFQVFKQNWVQNISQGVYCAFHNRNSRLLQKLLTLKLDKNVKQWVFDNACKKGYTEIVRILIESNDILLDNNNNEAIRKATFYNHSEIVDLLLKKQVKINANEDYLINWACRNNRLDIVKWFFTLSITKSNHYFEHHPFVCSLVTVASKGHLEIVEFLLTIKEVVNSIKFHGSLVEASRNGHAKIVELLLPESSKKHKDRAFEHLRLLLDQDKTWEVIKVFAKNGYYEETEYSNSIVELAMMKKQWKVIELFMENEKVYNNLTITEFAIRGGYFKVLKMLLKRIPLDNKKWMKSIKIAIINGHYDIIETLLDDDRFDPTVCNNTYIQHAREYRHFDIDGLLFSHPKVKEEWLNNVKNTLVK